MLLRSNTRRKFTLWAVYYKTEPRVTVLGPLMPNMRGPSYQKRLLLIKRSSPIDIDVCSRNYQHQEIQKHTTSRKNPNENASENYSRLQDCIQRSDAGRYGFPTDVNIHSGEGETT